VRKTLPEFKNCLPRCAPYEPGLLIVARINTSADGALQESLVNKKILEERVRGLPSSSRVNQCEE
jgi:hypothetical protein